MTTKQSFTTLHSRAEVQNKRPVSGNSQWFWQQSVVTCWISVVQAQTNPTDEDLGLDTEQCIVGLEAAVRPHRVLTEDWGRFVTV